MDTLYSFRSSSSSDLMLFEKHATETTEIEKKNTISRYKISSVKSNNDQAAYDCI